MLILENAHKYYRMHLVVTHALENVTLRIHRGEFVAIRGPSGSGKTTLLNVLGLLDSLDSGRYRLEGQETSELDDDALALLRNRKIGFIFQGFNLIPDMTVGENVEVPLRYQALNRSARLDRVKQALAQVGMSSRLQHFPLQLSGGQQQRVAIARALVTHPTLLLADEPTGNLDSKHALQIVELLETLNAGGTTILMVTHDASLALRARRTLHILDGKLIETHAQPVSGEAR